MRKSSWQRYETVALTHPTLATGTARITHAINTPYQHTPSTHPINSPYQPTLSNTLSTNLVYLLKYNWIYAENVIKKIYFKFWSSTTGGDDHEINLCSPHRQWGGRGEYKNVGGREWGGEGGGKVILCIEVEVSSCLILSCFLIMILWIKISNYTIKKDS